MFLLAVVEVSSIMTPEVVTIGPDVPAKEAATLMLRRRLKRLPAARLRCAASRR